MNKLNCYTDILDLVELATTCVFHVFFSPISIPCALRKALWSSISSPAEHFLSLAQPNLT